MITITHETNMILQTFFLLISPLVFYCIYRAQEKILRLITLFLAILLILKTYEIISSLSFQIAAVIIIISLGYFEEINNFLGKKIKPR